MKYSGFFLALQSARACCRSDQYKQAGSTAQASAATRRSEVFLPSITMQWTMVSLQMSETDPNILFAL